MSYDQHGGMAAAGRRADAARRGLGARAVGPALRGRADARVVVDLAPPVAALAPRSLRRRAMAAPRTRRGAVALHGLPSPGTPRADTDAPRRLSRRAPHRSSRARDDRKCRHRPPVVREPVGARTGRCFRARCAADASAESWDTSARRDPGAPSRRSARRAGRSPLRGLARLRGPCVGSGGARRPGAGRPDSERARGAEGLSAPVQGVAKKGRRAAHVVRRSERHESAPALARRSPEQGEVGRNGDHDQPSVDAWRPRRRRAGLRRPGGRQHEHQDLPAAERGCRVRRRAQRHVQDRHADGANARVAVRARTDGARVRARGGRVPRLAEPHPPAAPGVRRRADQRPGDARPGEARPPRHLAVPAVLAAPAGPRAVDGDRSQEARRSSGAELAAGGCVGGPTVTKCATQDASARRVTGAARRAPRIAAGRDTAASRRTRRGTPLRRTPPR